MAYYENSCIDAGEHFCDPCGRVESGRVGTVAFIDDDFVFPGGDLSNHLSWLTGINAGKIAVIPAVSGSLADPTAKEIPGTGRQLTRLIGYEFAATFQDPNYVGNCTFWNKIKLARNKKFAYWSETQVHLTNVPVVIIPGNAVPEDINSPVEWKVQVKWADKDLCCPMDKPYGIDNCPALGEA